MEGRRGSSSSFSQHGGSDHHHAHQQREQVIMAQMQEQQIVLRMLQSSLTSKIHARDDLIAQIFRAALDAGASAEAMESLQGRYAKLLRQTAGMKDDEVVKGLAGVEGAQAADGAGAGSSCGVVAGLKQEIERLQQALLQQQHQHKEDAEEMAALRRQIKTQQAERRRLLNLVHELKGNIRVLIRPRPLLEGDEGQESCMRLAPEGEVYLSYGRKHKHWEYDRVFGLGATQAEVYEEVAPIVGSVLDGYNGCVLAFGQTGAGKTHTMQGPPEDRGVHVRALQDLFEQIEERRAGAGVDEAHVSVSISVLEIYNDSIQDLLAAEEGSSGGAGGGARKWEIKQRPEGGMYVTDLTIVPVASLDQVLGLLQQGERRRAKAASKMNDHSSRSHLVLTVYVQHAAASGVTTTTRAKLHLVDLAGSERVRKSGAEGQALEEAKCINKSLSALGDVIHARLAKAPHVPYRNSQLTYLLQDSLGSRDSKVAFLVCVSTSLANAEESSCTLQFASRVRRVEMGKAARNVVVVPDAVPSPPLDERSGGGDSDDSSGGTRGGGGRGRHQGRTAGAKKATR